MSIPDRTPLYQQIAESVRKEILYGNLAPGDRLPSVREMAGRWRCTPGTVQQAYRELAGTGLVVSRAGQGTHVASQLPVEAGDAEPLRRAALIHRAEAFLLQVLAAGYNASEVELAVRTALDRWRGLAEEPSGRLPVRNLRFVGSHDPALSLIAARFDEIARGASLQVSYAGSLGGLIAIARGEADLAGCHLWDEETDCYNAPFVQRLLPGRRVALLTLAHRRLGLIVASGNPEGLRDLTDLPSLRFINRQQGAGTRVWLDAQLRRLGIDHALIVGYGGEVATHGEVASAVAEGRADAGLGVETAALSYGLDFVPLTTERYDLVVPDEIWPSEPVQALVAWLASTAAREAIGGLGGYETGQTGAVSWIG